MAHGRSTIPDGFNDSDIPICFAPVRVQLQHALRIQDDQGAISEVSKASPNSLSASPDSTRFVAPTVPSSMPRNESSACGEGCIREIAGSDAAAVFSPLLRTMLMNIYLDMTLNDRRGNPGAASTPRI